MRTTIACLFLAATSGCTDGSAPDAPVAADAGAEAAETDAGRSGPADPGAPGPWAIGVRTIEIVDASRQRTLAVEVWYPADPLAPGGTPNAYDTGSFDLATAALRGAAPADGGPFPLVVFSHGYGGVRFQSFFLTEHLASHGIVVAAPDHPGNTIYDLAQLGDDEATAQSAVDRPLDVQLVVDRLVAGVADLPIAVDAGRVGLTGHSFGGWTALETARRDPRARVVFPMAPGFRAGATPDFVAELARPLCLFGGSEDDTTPFESDQRAPYDLARSPKMLVEILGAGHLDFSNLCDVPGVSSFVDDGCDPEKVDPAEVHGVVRTIATAFVGRYLFDDEAYDTLLEPEGACAVGVAECWRSP